MKATLQVLLQLRGEERLARFAIGGAVAASFYIEAVATAVDRRYEDVAVPVVTADYLCAIALQTGRVKDFQRVYSLLEAGCVDAAALRRLVAAHGLQERWNAYARRYA